MISKHLGHLIALISSLVSVAALAASPIPTGELAQAITQDKLKVAEFAEIAKMAEDRGLRAYLFGGTAAGLAHYIKLDWLRHHGDAGLVPALFDFEYTHIYRQNQDLDIVITRKDGAPESLEQIHEFQSALQERFPYGAGEKSDWEVRGLRTANGPKTALLDTPDFLNQHTDSNSTGLIELTTPPPGETDVKDLRQMSERTPYFLRDVAGSSLHYYFSPQHSTTSRFLQGLNPPILSVIRYLIKAFQYDSEIDPESLKHLQQIIDSFDPTSVTNPYVQHWIEKYGKKLFQNAMDLERAWNTLEDLGLRRKLIAVQNNARIFDSLAWWMSKEPLRSLPYPGAHAFPAAPEGRTARELGIEYVNHAAKVYPIYESITRSPRGKPNLLISRSGVEGESASEGEGCYTMKGTIPAAFLPKFPIRLKVDPEAREGVDFTQVGDFIIWRKSTHLHVVPEDFKPLSPVETLRFLVDPANATEGSTKFRLVRSASKLPLDAQALQESRQIIQGLVETGNWVGVADTILYPPMKALVHEELAKRRIGLNEIIALIAGPGTNDSRFALRQLGMDFVTNTPAYLALFRPYTATGYEMIRNGLQLLESADRALRFNPPPKIAEMRQLSDATFYAMPHFNQWLEKLLPQVRTADDYLALVSFPQWTDHNYIYYDQYISSFIRGTWDNFLKLNPTPKQIEAAKQCLSWPKDALFFMARDGLHTLKSPKDWLKVLDTVPYSPDKSAFVTQHLDRFLALKPTVAERREMLHHIWSIPDLFAAHEKVLNAATSAEEFAALAPIIYDPASNEYQAQYAQWLPGRIVHFLALNPSPSEMAQFLKGLKVPAAQAAALEQLLPRARTAPDFIAMVQAVEDKPTHSPALMKNYDLFLSLHPSAEEMQKLNHEAWFVPDLVSVTEKLLARAQDPESFLAASQILYNPWSQEYWQAHRTLIDGHLARFMAMHPAPETVAKLATYPYWETGDQERLLGKYLETELKVPGMSSSQFGALLERLRDSGDGVFRKRLASALKSKGTTIDLLRRSHPSEWSTELPEVLDWSLWRCIVRKVSGALP